MAQLTGTSSSDTITGTSGDDFIQGFAGNDDLAGGDGNDTFEGGDGNDTIYGEYGENTALFTGIASQYTITFQNWTFTVIDNVPGRDGTDLLNVQNLQFADKTLTTFDFLGPGIVGTDHNDTLKGTSLAEVISGGAGADSISAGDGADTIFGDAGKDTILGGAGNDDIYGGDDAEKLVGGPGNDYIDPGHGSDTIDGGDGIDCLDYEWPESGVNVNLLTGIATGGYGTQTITGIEIVGGSMYEDVLTGDAANNELDGKQSADTLRGGAGDDTLYGGDDDDLLEGDAGDDLIRGDAGIDTVTYQHATGPVTASLGYTGKVTGAEGVDTIQMVENFIGSNYGDSVNATIGMVNGAGGDDLLVAGGANVTLFGDEGNDTLRSSSQFDVMHGGTGDDVLASEGGNDTLYGDDGNDTLWGLADTIDGGNGLDTVRFADGYTEGSILAQGVGTTIVISGSLGQGARVDVLTNVERLQFADRTFALDIDGHAGEALRIVGAALGEAGVYSPSWIGVALSAFDRGWSFGAVADAAADLLFSECTDEQFVSRVFENVVHFAPDAQTVAYFAHMLASTTRGEMLAMAANTYVNEVIVGVADPSLHFVEYLIP